MSRPLYFVLYLSIPAIPPREDSCFPASLSWFIRCVVPLLRFTSFIKLSVFRRFFMKNSSVMSSVSTAPQFTASSVSFKPYAARPESLPISSRRRFRILMSLAADISSLIFFVSGRFITSFIAARPCEPVFSMTHFSHSSLCLSAKYLWKFSFSKPVPARMMAEMFSFFVMLEIISASSE